MKSRADLDAPALVLGSELMRNSAYTVFVRSYLLGQHRIQLCDNEQLDELGKPRIIRECCTYDPSLMARTVGALRASTHPEAVLTSLERPWNCEGPGLRIRLDNRLADRVEMQHLRKEYPDEP